MRTGIYVYSSATLTFSATEPLAMTSYTNDYIAVDGTTWTCTLSPGIYKMFTDSTVTVTSSGDIDVVAHPNNKDEFPDPPPRAQTVWGVTTSSINTFFTDLKSTDF